MNGIDISLTTQTILIVTLCTIAVGSVLSGVGRGIRLLSQWNMLLSLLLVLIVLAIGPTRYIFNIFFESTGNYLQNIVQMGLWTDTQKDTNWQSSWTSFYWPWWMTWAPFVGMFIARVSKGRTVREFLFAVIFVPTLMTIIWMAIFGGIAIDQVVNKVGELGASGLTDVSLTLFQVYDALPFGSAISVLSIVLILIFFVTSSDSGSLVIDSITSGGKIDAPIPQRIFWATLEGAIAAVMLWIGGKEALQALQSGVVVTALPFIFVLLLMCVSLIKGLNSERALYK